MQRINQPAIVGQLLAGIVLGPTVFGTLLPGIHETLFPKAAPQKAMIDAVGQLGVLLILMLTGMETDLGLVKRIGRSAIIVAFAGVALPFGCGFLLGQFIPDSLLPDHANRTIASLFLGTALSISSVKIVALVVRELNFLRRDVGQTIVASAVIEDTIGWVIIAITFGLASQDSFDYVAIAKSVVGTAVFLVVSLTIGRRVMFWLIRWANDVLVSEFAVVTLAIVVMCAMALITHLIGVHTVLGAFVAGILIGESPILVGYIDQQLRGVITALFMPVFFGLAGIGADLSILGDPRLALLTLGLIAIASVGKFSGAFVGGKFGGLSTREALALGCAMNARGPTEVIVATIGLSMGVLSQNLFTMILTMAVVTTTAMPPMLRWALARLPLRDAEKIRLEREEADRKSLIALEGALAAALLADPELTSEAIARNVNIATPTTLMVALRTAASVWQIERRNLNAEAIADRAGSLYDKFVGFVSDMDSLGEKLEQAQRTYGTAFAKLSKGPGNLVRQAELLRGLGAKTAKTLPQKFIEADDAPILDAPSAT